MQSGLTLIVALLLSVSAAFSQQGIITGKITDASNNQVLIGATITVKNSKIKTLSDVDGAYHIGNLSAGEYTLEISFVGYATKQVNEVSVINAKVTTLNITLEQQSTAMKDVIVTTTSARKETLNSILVTRKNAAVVSDAISADIIRRSPDKSISDVLKRISGTTVQDNKFVVIRGMNDRYNEAMMNGALLPSTEPDRKTFAFDIFPSDIVDNITIIKSALPEYPGTFAGGLTQVNLKDVPDKNFFSIKAGFGYNTITTGNSFYHDQPGGTDFLGLDDGTREIPKGFPGQEKYNSRNPKKQVEYAKLFPNDWSLEQRSSAPVNTSLQLSAGFNASGKKGYPKVGGIFVISYNSTYKYSANVVRDYGAITILPDSVNKGYPYYDFNDSGYVHSVLNSGLANFALKLNPNNKFFFNNLVAINSSNQTVVRHGLSSTIGSQLPGSYFGYAHYFQSNVIYNSQLGGEHYLSKLRLRIKWMGYYTKFHRNEPDYRQMIYYQNFENAPYYAYISSPTLFTTITGGLRSYFETEDEAKGTNIDLNKSFKLFNQNQSLKFGFTYYYDTRTRDGRFLRNDMPNYNEQLLVLPPDKIFDTANFDHKNGFVTTDFARPEWIEYNGNIQNTSGYVMFDNKFTDKLRMAWGVRYETYNNRVVSYVPNDTIPYVVDTSFSDFLPSANLVYAVTPKTNIRLSYSKTVARPLYRELAKTLFYDFFQNITYTGNSLTETHIDNYEIRWEQYFQNAQYYSLSAYYKKFKDPIEQKIVISGADSKTVTWENAPSAELWGIEGEARKNFGFISHALSDLYFYVNASYIHSVAFVKGNGSDTANRPLQGQSPYVVNASLQYSSEKNGLNVSLMYNIIGARIALVGGPNYTYPLWEQPHALLDFKISKAVLKNGLVELSLADILHKKDVLFENFDDNKKYNESYPDVLIQSKTFGMTATVSVGYRF